MEKICIVSLILRFLPRATQLRVPEFHKILSRNPLASVSASHCPSILHRDGERTAATAEWGTVTSGPGTRRNVQASQELEGNASVSVLSQRPRHLGLPGRAQSLHRPVWTKPFPTEQAGRQHWVIFCLSALETEGTKV